MPKVPTQTYSIIENLMHDYQHDYEQGRDLSASRSAVS